MKIVDANVLVYSVDADSNHHRASGGWLDGALSRSEPIGFCWPALIAFLRISTNPAIFPNPLSVDQATRIATGWMAARPAVLIEPTRGHVDALRSLLEPTGTGGNLVNDAHLAALALQHDATVVSYDNDFDRFPGVRWERPSG